MYKWFYFVSTYVVDLYIVYKQQFIWNFKGRFFNP